MLWSSLIDIDRLYLKGIVIAYYNKKSNYVICSDYDKPNYCMLTGNNRFPQFNICEYSATYRNEIFIVSSDIENWNYLKESFQNFRQGEKASLITRNLKVTHSFEVSIWHFKIERRQNIWRLLLRWEEILKDTEKNTQLALKVRGETYPVRDCAIKTILDRAGSSGAGLRKLEKSNYARVVNYCLKVAKGDALIKIADGKYLPYTAETAMITAPLICAQSLRRPCIILTRTSMEAVIWKAPEHLTILLDRLCGSLEETRSIWILTGLPLPTSLFFYYCPVWMFYKIKLSAYSKSRRCASDC